MCAAGQPLTMTLDGVIYYYVLNIQGDVMGMVDGDGNLLYTMVYEGYGAGYYFSGGTTAATMLLGTNPLGYRGYVMDAGTGLYYLQSRYYDPAWGRFINADAFTSTGQGMLGNNMFAYCLNNTVNMVDYTGNKPGDLFDTPDDAAKDFALCYNEQSINDKQEYGSAIYMIIVVSITYHETSGLLPKLGIRQQPHITISIKYSYTEPAIGKNGDSVTPNLSTTKPIVSTVHTHANYDPKYDNENFSDGGLFSDIGWSNLFKMNSYVVTPGGYLKKYTYNNRNDVNGGVTVIASDIPWDPNSPDH